MITICLQQITKLIDRRFSVNIFTCISLTLTINDTYMLLIVYIYNSPTIFTLEIQFLLVSLVITVTSC